MYNKIGIFLAHCCIYLALVILAAVMVTMLGLLMAKMFVEAFCFLVVAVLISMMLRWICRPQS